MTLLSSVPRRTISLFGILLASLLLCAPQNAKAQAKGDLWLQTSKVITPIEQGPVRVLLDTLVNVMERKKLKVRRSPDSKKRMTIKKLRSTLINQEGIGIRSANHAFIDYRFSIDKGSRFRQRIAKVQFVFRPGPNQSDIPVLYLDARTKWLKAVLQNKGTDLATNEAALIPFKRHLGFEQVAREKESQIVEIGGQTVRKGFHEKKEALIRKVERLTYESYV